MSAVVGWALEPTRYVASTSKTSRVAPVPYEARLTVDHPLNPRGHECPPYAMVLS